METPVAPEARLERHTTSVAEATSGVWPANRPVAITPTDGWAVASAAARTEAHADRVRVVGAGLIASLAAFLVAEGLRVWPLAAGRVDVVDWLHSLGAGLFVALTFGVLLVAWRLLCSTIEASEGSARMRLLLLGLVNVTLPGGLLAYWVTSGTRLGKPFTAVWWGIATALLVGGPLLAWGAVRVKRLAVRTLHRWPRAAVTALAGACTAAAAVWVVVMAPYKHLYGPSHLLSFGLLLLFFFYIALTLARRNPPRHSARRRALWVWGGLQLAALAAFFVPPSADALELFHGERPYRWFARALTGALPDRDGDGVPGGFGFLVGADCDDSDAARAPGLPETPNNGHDENCFGGDQSAEAFHRIAVRPRNAAPRNVVLIVVDGLRFEPGLDGGVDPALMPRVAALAAESLRFEDYRVCAARTRESLADLLGGDLLDPEELPTRPHAIRGLADAGVRTTWISSRWLRRYDRLDGWAETAYVDGRYGEFRDGEVVDEVLRRLRQPADGPSFLFLHLLSAHEPYETEAECAADDLRGRYDCALAQIDGLVGRLVDELATSGQLQNTVVALTADHGEEFGEHGANFHSTTVYDELLHVPLLIRAPGLAPERIGEAMGCYDLMPTLLSAAGLTIEVALPGRDFSAAPRPLGRAQLARTRDLDETGTFEPRLQAVTLARHKLVLDLTTGLTWTFDLAADPAEQRPLSTVDPRIAAELTEAMEGWLTEQARIAQAGRRAE